MRALLVVLILLAGLVIGLVTGILSRSAGAHPAKAALDGGAGCGAAITLGVVVLNAVGLL